jgi:hypothetical protein
MTRKVIGIPLPSSEDIGRDEDIGSGEEIGVVRTLEW